MTAKEKIIGLIIVIIGALPFLLKIKGVEESFAKSQVLTYLIPGEIVYQIVLIILGVILLWESRYARYRRY